MALNPKSHSRDVQAWHLFAVSFAIGFGFCGLVAETLYEARLSNWRNASQSAANLAHAVAEEIGRTIEGMDLSIQAVADNSRVPGVADLEPHLRRLMLFDRAATARHLGSIMMLDEQGNLTMDSRSETPSGVSFADRENFRHHQATAADAMHISGPFRGRLLDEWLFQVSRRLAHADGSFAGMVGGAVRLESIRALFERMDLGSRGSLALVRNDGIVLMRTPYRETFLGSDISSTDVFRRLAAAPSGQFIAASPVDGAPKLYSSMAIAGTPLMVTVALAVEDLEAGWRRHAVLLGLALLVLIGAWVTVSLFLARELRHRQRAEASAQRSEAVARESEARFRLLAESCSDMVSRIGRDGVRLYVSPASRRILGRSPESLTGRPVQEQVHPNDIDTFDAAAKLMRAGGAEETTVSYRTRRADGEWIWVESTIRIVRDSATGQSDGVVAVTRDLTERKKLEAELTRLAALDGLTGISNRRAFDEKLEREWLASAQEEQPLSIVLVDVDHFKLLNDRYGHQRGDECLRQVASVLNDTVRRKGDLVARYGGEEFALILPDTDAAGATTVAERVRSDVEALALPHEASGSGFLTVSVGSATTYALRRLDAEGQAALVKAADEALFKANAPAETASSTRS